jgi:hypothetical protein
MFSKKPNIIPDTEVKTLLSLKFESLSSILSLLLLSISFLHPLYIEYANNKYKIILWMKIF